MSDELKNKELSFETPEQAEQPQQTEQPQQAEQPRFDVDIQSAEASIPDYIPTAQPVYDFEVDTRRKRHRPRKRGAGCLSGIVYIVIVIALSIGLASVILTIVNDVTGLVKDDTVITVEVPDGATLTDIAEILQQNGLIESSVGLRIYAALANKDYSYQKGTFDLNPRMGYGELLRKLSQTTVVMETARVTIIEGKTINEIADTLESMRVCSANDFIDALATHDYSSYSFIANLPDDEERIHKLEGYIFPDTYDFYVGSDVDTVVKKFLNNFDNRFNAELRAAAKEQGLTVDEVVILASMIQKEGASDKSMKYVSSVFRNRLAHAADYPYLQSNATLSYALGEPIIWISNEQMDNDNVYNTYNHKGLPPSAICNPGLAAIKAALYPEKTDYYYFVTDENGIFYFSKTLKQHEKQTTAIQDTGKGIGDGIK